MEDLLIKTPLFVTIILGSSLLAYLAFRLLWKTADLILGLLEFSKILIEWTRYKGKCKECRSNDVHTPKLRESD